jgi:hypothetical protein
MKLKLANAALHGLHLMVIVLVVVGWAFDATRPAQLVVCILTLLSWFVLGPLVGQPGMCFLTDFQHRLWRRTGRGGNENYMSYLFRRLTGHEPSSAGARRIDLATQAVLYTCTGLSIYLS